ncbi:TPA: hypothetical protein ACX1S2_004197 [Yersinia enterocolitica]
MTINSDFVLDGKAQISQSALAQEQGHSLLLGKPGAGMSVTNPPLFIVQSDVRQLKDIYAGEDKERLDKLAENVRKNCTIWFSIKLGAVSEHIRCGTSSLPTRKG